MIAQLHTEASEQAEDHELDDDVRLQEQRDQRDVARGRHGSTAGSLPRSP